MRTANRHDEAKNVAYFILACPNDIGADAARKCFEVLGKQADEQALTVLSATEDPIVQQACLLHLGSKARPHAKRLLRQSTNGPLQALCISLLGEEAIQDADRLLKANSNAVLTLTCLKHVPSISQTRLERIFQATNNVEVQIKCVRMMKGKLQRRCATELLSATSNSTAIIECLKICNDLPVPVVTDLLESHHNVNVRVACLRG